MKNLWKIERILGQIFILERSGYEKDSKILKTVRIIFLQKNKQKSIESHWMMIIA